MSSFQPEPNWKRVEQLLPQKKRCRQFHLPGYCRWGQWAATKCGPAVDPAKEWLSQKEGGNGTFHPSGGLFFIRKEKRGRQRDQPLPSQMQVTMYSGCYSPISSPPLDMRSAVLFVRLATSMGLNGPDSVSTMPTELLWSSQDPLIPQPLKTATQLSWEHLVKTSRQWITSPKALL